jgi:hypothetical protein
MTNATEKIFELRYDFTGVAVEAYDGVLDRFEGCENLMLNITPRDSLPELPNEVWFWGSLARIRKLDFLKVDVRWTVCSKRLLSAVEALGDFPHLTIPAHFVEAAEGKEKQTLEDQYVVLVITEPTDALDVARSKLMHRSDGTVQTVLRYAFHSLPGGIPPMFKVKQDVTALLIAERTKQALEAGGFARIQILPQERIGLL